MYFYRISSSIHRMDLYFWFNENNAIIKRVLRLSLRHIFLFRTMYVHIENVVPSPYRYIDIHWIYPIETSEERIAKVKAVNELSSVQKQNEGTITTTIPNSNNNNSDAYNKLISSYCAIFSTLNCVEVIKYRLQITFITFWHFSVNICLKWY